MHLGGGSARRRITTRWLAIPGLLIAGLALLVPAALAAPPVNDNFADRETLSGSLPIEVTRSNVGATQEADEDLEGSTAGHSVWFKWEATDSGWTTIGACQGTIVPVVAIFEGANLESLVKVARVGLVDHSSEGPNCPTVEQEFTIKAVAGTTYSIAVDGNTNLTIKPPGTEGEFTLRIESRPPPANDDFEDATALSNEIFGEPGPDQFARAGAFGYTWGATKEAGEPNHGGNQGGASVWYSWTPPGSGMATVSACCSAASELIGVYLGDAVDNLTALPVVEGAAFPVSDGVNYKIAIDGLYQPGEGTTVMGSFPLHLSTSLSTSAPSAPLPIEPILNRAPDTTPPGTTIVKRKLRPAARKAVFRFHSSEPGASFAGSMGAALPPASPRRPTAA